MTTVINGSIRGQMTIINRQASAVLQKHITGASIGDTEATVNVGTTHGGRSGCQNSPTTVLGNAKYYGLSAPPVRLQPTTTVNNDARNNTSIDIRRSTIVNGNACGSTANHPHIPTAVNGCICGAATTGNNLGPSAVNGGVCRCITGTQ